jgi:hypothetical protein
VFREVKGSKGELLNGSHGKLSSKREMGFGPQLQVQVLQLKEVGVGQRRPEGAN